MITETDKLTALPLFSGLIAEESKYLSLNSRICKYKRGKAVFYHGEAISYFYVVCQGVVQIFRETPDGHEVTSDMMIAGDPINSEDIFSTRYFHTSSARVVDDAAILKIPVAWMETSIDSLGQTSAHLIRGLSRRLFNSQLEAEHQSTMTATQILACFLQRLCILYNFNPDSFKLPYSKTLIASRLRMELSTFSRAIARLKEEGITIKGMHVSFTDRQKTGRFVCNHCSMSENCPAHIYLHKTLL